MVLISRTVEITNLRRDVDIPFLHKYLWKHPTNNKSAHHHTPLMYYSLYSEIPSHSNPRVHNSNEDCAIVGQNSSTIVDAEQDGLIWEWMVVLLNTYNRECIVEQTARNNTKTFVGKQQANEEETWRWWWFDGRGGIRLLPEGEAKHFIIYNQTTTYRRSSSWSYNWRKKYCNDNNNNIQINNFDSLDKVSRAVTARPVFPEP